MNALAAPGTVLSVLAAGMLTLQVVFIRIGTNNGSVTRALVTVLGINVVLLGSGTLIAYYPNYNVTPFSFIVFASAGLSGTVLARSLYYISIDRIGASRTEPIKSSQPLHATLVAVLVLNKVVTIPYLFGIVLIVAGIAAISWETNKQSSASGDNSQSELLFPLGAAFFFGIEPTFIKLGFAEGTPVFVGLSIKTLAAAIGFIIYLRIRGLLPAWDDFRTDSSHYYIAAGLANTAFLVTYFLALEVAPVTLVVPIVQSSPLLILLVSYFFLNRLETVTWRLSVAAIVSVVGTIIVTLAS